MSFITVQRFATRLLIRVTALADFDRWTALHKTVTVPFDQPNDDPRAFFNANTLAELHSLETR